MPPAAQPALRPRPPDSRRRARPPRPQKAAAKKAAGDKKPKAGAKSAAAAGDEVLADPLAEKLRQQRLQEAADLEHARAAFGEASKNLDDLLPRTEAVRPRAAPRKHAAACAPCGAALMPRRCARRRTSRSTGS